MHPYIFYDWQLYDFHAVEKFIEAAQEKNYAGANLTQERLESYMHGWAILLYMMYGYDENGSPGGIFRHYSWNAEDILRFIGEPFLNHFEITNIDVSGNAGHLGDIAIDLVADALLWRGLIFQFIDPNSYARDYILKDPLMLIQRIVHIASGNDDSTVYNQPWPYFLTPNGLNDVIGYASGWENDSVATSYLWTIKREINTWDLYNQYLYYPFKREFYEGELTSSLDLDEQYKQSIRSGATYLDYTPGTIARKSGILGGMYPIDETRDYNKQPGVFDMHFEFDGDYIYTQSSLPMQGDPPLVDLRYDLLISGISRVELYLNNGTTPLSRVTLPGLSRQKSFLSGALDQVGEVSFEVRSGEKTSNPTQFCRMFTSDYRDAYNSHWYISGNPYYQELFKDGDPVRESGEDPLANPKSYWPYVLPVTEGSGYYLSAPTNLKGYVEAISQDNRYAIIALYWNDNSGCEHGYQIYRDGHYLGTVGENATSYFDGYKVFCGSSYKYKVRAYRNDGYYSTFSNTITVSVPSGGGCPFLFVIGDSSARLENSLLAGSGSSNVVTDWYKMETPLEAKNDRYRLEIREFENEHSWLNQTRLLAIDHPDSVEIYVTQDGLILPVKELMSASIVLGINEEDYTYAVEKVDNVYIEGANDYQVAKFRQLSNGEDYAVVLDVGGKKTAAKIESEDGEEIGDISFREFPSRAILPIVSTSELNVRLKWCSPYKLDYIGIGKIKQTPYHVKPCPLVSATHSDIGSVKQKLLVDDENYAELLPGDTITLEFTTVGIEPGWVRDFVFVSNGYYITERGGGSQTAYSSIPLVHSLSLYPNPARNDMTIRFGIPREEKVSLKVYDVSGREVKTLVDDRLEAGYHTTRLDDGNLPSGIYFARLVTDGYEATKKLVLMR